MWRRIGAALLCLLLLSQFACKKAQDTSKENHRIWLVYELQTEDDVYEVLSKRYIDGEQIGEHGGSNHDGSKLGETFSDWVEYETDADGKEYDYSRFGIRLYVRNEPVDMENDAIFDGAVEVEPMLTFKAEFDHKYTIRIEGSREKGYTAAFLGEKK